MFKKILFSLISIISLSAQAATPLFSLTAQTPTSFNLHLNDTAQVKYLLTNNTSRNQKIVMNSIQGASQDLTVPNACSNPINVGPTGSCVIALNFTGANIPVSGVRGGPVVCKTLYGTDQPNPFACVQPLDQAQLNVNRVGGAAPTIASITPSYGSTSIAGNVTISGTLLANTTSVKFGDVSGTIQSITDASVVVTYPTPFSTEGPVNVTLTSPYGSSTSDNGFTYYVNQFVSTVSPNTGSISRGQTVILTGTNLLEVNKVILGSASDTPSYIASQTDTQIVITTHAHAAGLVDLRLSTPSDPNYVLANAFTYGANPTITTISPTSGSTNGAQTVTITGANLSTTSSVTIGGLTAPITGSTATTVTVTTPAHAAGAVDVVVTTDYYSVTSANGFTYVAPPTITGFSPGTGSTLGGTTVVVTGTDFTTVSGASAVTVGGNNATYTVDSATQITLVTPAGTAGPQNTVITSSYGTVTAAGFTYVAPPTITGFTPGTGSTLGGTSVAVTGTGFTTVSGASAVKVGGVNATSYTVTDDTHITLVTPAGTAGPQNTVITSSYGTVTAAGFTYVAPPTITNINPVSGGSNDTITITGTGFVTGTTSVDFTQGVVSHLGTSVTVSSSTSLTVVTPSFVTAVGPVDVQVTTPYGSVTLTNGYDYTLTTSNKTQLPVIQSFYPEGGLTKGGNEVLVRGYLLKDVNEIRFGDKVAKILKQDDFSLTVLAPAHDEGKVNITLVSSKDKARSSNAYHYTNAPVVTSIQPNSGSINGQYPAVIKGYNLDLVDAVNFDGVRITIDATNDPYAVKVNVPTGASAGKVDVGVYGKNNMGSMMASGFEYLANALTANQDHLELSVNNPELNAALIGQPRKIIITNNGTAPIGHVHYKISPDLPAGTTVSPEECGTIAVAGQCELTVNPGAVASGKPLENVKPSIMTISGNDTNQLNVEISVLSYGQIFNQGFIFSIDDTNPEGSVHGKFIALEDATAEESPLSWGPVLSHNDIQCTQEENGYCNSNAFVALLSQQGLGLSSYPAGICAEVAGQSSWFLPAICELAPLEGVCDVIQSVKTSLVDTGILTGLNHQYWSSSVAEDYIWTHVFKENDDRNALEQVSKELHVRCASAF